MIKSVRIKPISNDMVSVEITCQCGGNMMTDQTTRERGASRSVMTGARHQPQSPTLICDCGKQFKIFSEEDGVYII